MPVRKSKSRRSREARNWQGALMIGFVVLSLAGIAGSALYFVSQRRPIDAATNCPTDRLDHVTAVLIDLTDPISKTQQVALSNALTELRDKTPQYGRLDIYTITSAAGADRNPLFSLCNPGTGANIDSNLTGNRALADRIWKRDFGEKIDVALDQATRVTPMEASPLLEAVQFVAARTFGVPIVRDAGAKRLIVVSDLLHHSADLSLYRQTPQHSEFRRGQYYTRIKPQLQGASVELLVLFRETRRNAQQRPLQNFWEEHIREAGGRLELWKPLQ
jgi:hypothetical protein